MKIPEHITKTLLKPDSHFLFNINKELLLYKLTIPWEDNITQAHKRKLDEYQKLKEIYQNNGWKPHY